MAKRGKKYQAAKAKVDVLKQYTLLEGIALAKETSYSKFTGAVELHVKTGANPKFNDQMLRGTVVLPHGTGKSVKVAAFVGDEMRKEATDAGADLVGKEDLLSDIEAGKIDFDVLVTTPDMMRDLAKVAKALGPKGLMPSPKAGTVSNNIGNAISEIKKGRVEYKLDKTGNVHVGIGKGNFSDEQLADNITALLKSMVEHKPTGVKGKLIRKIVVASTMGPGVQIENSVE